MSLRLGMKPPGNGKDRVKDRVRYGVKNKDSVTVRTIAVDRQIHHVDKKIWYLRGESSSISPLERLIRGKSRMHQIFIIAKIWEETRKFSSSERFWAPDPKHSLLCPAHPMNDGRVHCRFSFYALSSFLSPLSSLVKIRALLVTKIPVVITGPFLKRIFMTGTASP